MSIEAIGAGAGRTGTQSLKVALERLLGGSCYDNNDILRNPDHVAVWSEALDGGEPDWDALFADYSSVVDMTAALMFRELAAAYPNAIVVLSLRDPDSWWRSFESTVAEVLRNPKRGDPLEQALAPARELTVRTFDQRFTPEWFEEGPAKRAYARHNDAVRESVPADRLVEWRPADGWEPICAALGVAAPAEPFPHVNTTADFRTMAGRERAG